MKNNRKCIATNVVMPKEDLIRIVKTKNNQFFVDSEEKGRGAYISRSSANISELQKKRLLNKSFKGNVPNEVYEKLIKILEGC